MYWFNTIVIFFGPSSSFGSVVKMLQSLYLRVASDSKLDTFFCGVQKARIFAVLTVFLFTINCTNYKLIKIGRKNREYF